MSRAPFVLSRSRFVLLALALLFAHEGKAQGTTPKPVSVPLASTPASNTLEAAREALNATDYASAEGTLKALRGKDEAMAKVLLARLYTETGRAKLAVVEASSAIALGKKTEGSFEKAKALFALGDTKAAVQILEPFRKDTSAASRPLRLLLGETLIATGHRADAEEPLMTLPADYNNDAIDEKDSDGMAMVGRAAHLLRVPKDAHQAYKESIRANKLNLDTKRWWADLYFDKYDTGHAEEHAKEVLKIAPNHADTLVLMAAIKLEQSFDFDGAEALLTKALAVNPVHGRALSMRAGLRLRDLDTGNADAIVREGLRANPNDLSLLAMKAVIRFLADDMRGFAEAKKEMFARNAEYAEFYLTFGTYAEWEHRYEDLVISMKEAVKMDPENGKLWAELGLWQLRAGEEEEGLKALNKGFSKDKFNVRAYNTLNLYDKQIKFDYEMVDTGPIRVRLQKDERAMLGRYVPRLLGEAFASMKTRYNFVPKLPVQVEIYNSREQFSVRTHGLPNIGIQGVCFGNMIAAISPSAEPFNWGNVLWHELGHVFAIQMSKNHVPRWFTEGLSEYETIARRPEWQREMDRDLYLALRRGSLP
ncbi:MAG: hypothetical protein KBF88_15565, partial [Polyangiaceae bacterium]|nr:hypothetical protein [Polyangiaceae bacterium]